MKFLFYDRANYMQSDDSTVIKREKERGVGELVDQLAPINLNPAIVFSNFEYLPSVCFT